MTHSRRVFGFCFAIYAILVMITFAGLVTPLILPAALLPRGRRERFGMFGARIFAWLILRALLLLRVHVDGLQLLPTRSGYLVVANHRSWVDIPLLLLYTWSNGISKKEVRYVPFFALNGGLSGALFFDRNSAEDRRRVVRDAMCLLRAGANLHVFPEGSRTRSGRLAERVHLRLVEAAWAAGIEVVPACVYRTDRVVPAGRIYAWPGATVGITLGPVARPADFADPAAFAAAVWGRVGEMAARLGADEERSV